MDDLRRLTSVPILPGRHQARVGQPPHERPLRLEIGLGRDAPRVLGALARLHELHEDTAGPVPIRLVQRLVHGVRVPCDGALHPPDRLVGLVRQPAIALSFPEPGQREFEQGEPPRLLAHVVDDPIDESRLEGPALQLGRAGDGPRQFLAVHRSQDDVVVLHRVREGAVGQRVTHEIGP